MTYPRTSRAGFPALLLLLALLAMLLPGAVPAAHAAIDQSAERDFVNRVNSERSARGIAQVRVCTELRGVARRHTRRMASQSHLHHNPNLASDISDWRRLSENVGRGGSVSSLHQALMNSEGHRRNILDANVTQIGVGVEVVDGQMWVTQNFRLPASGAACTSPSTTTTAAAEPVVDTGSRLLGDFTGDGRQELLRFDPATGDWLGTRWTASGFATQRWGRFKTRTGWEHLVGDFSGDGRDEVASYHEGAGTWFVSRLSGSSLSTQRSGSFATRRGWEHLVGDFSGDGRDEVASYHEGAGTWFVSRLSGSLSTQRSGSFATRTGWEHLAGDVTGNGVEDVASYHHGAGSTWLSQSLLEGFSLSSL